MIFSTSYKHCACAVTEFHNNTQYCSAVGSPSTAGNYFMQCGVKNVSLKEMNPQFQETPTCAPNQLDHYNHYHPQSSKSTGKLPLAELLPGCIVLLLFLYPFLNLEINKFTIQQRSWMNYIDSSKYKHVPLSESAKPVNSKLNIRTQTWNDPIGLFAILSWDGSFTHANHLLLKSSDNNDSWVKQSLVVCHFLLSTLTPPKEAWEIPK